MSAALPRLTTIARWPSESIDQARLALRELGERAGARQSPAVHDEDAALGDAGGVQVELGRVQLDVPEPVGRGHAGAHRADGHHRPGNVEPLERRDIQGGS